MNNNNNDKIFLFLTGTLRCYNSDFFQWLYFPGIVKIEQLNVHTSSSFSQTINLFYQREDKHWNQMTGSPIENSVPWHCVAILDENANNNNKYCSVEGDVISIDLQNQSRHGQEIYNRLCNEFFKVDQGIHSVVEIKLDQDATNANNSVVYHTFIYNTKHENTENDRWKPVPNNKYVTSSEFPSLPIKTTSIPIHTLYRSTAKIPKIIVIILDGAADSHNNSNNNNFSESSNANNNNNNNNNKTPLEAACETSPGLSVITRNGFSGMMDPFEPGFACGSDTAHLNLFGFPPHLWYRGRGAFESLGAGMEMIPGQDIAFKSNFATIADDGTNIVLKRRCDRNFVKEGPILCEALDGMEVDVALTDEDSNENKEISSYKYKVSVKYATEHRCGVVISGPNLSDKISGTDPLVDNKMLVPCTPTTTNKNNTSALLTCRVVEAVSNQFRKRLSEHPINKERIEKLGKSPANVILLRGAAQTAPNPPFGAVHGSCFLGSSSWSSSTNSSCFAIAPTCIISGFAKSIGMVEGTEKFTKEAIALGATGDVHSELESKAKVCLSALFGTSRQDDDDENQVHRHFAIVHVKGCDDAGHDGHPDVKAEVLARAGKMMQMLWDGADEGTCFAVFADHSTPCTNLDHGCDPVPVSLAIKKKHDKFKCDGDGCRFYTEAEVAQTGSLGRFKGEDLMKLIKTMLLGEMF